jgi:L-tyrosine isonitrile synthase
MSNVASYAAGHLAALSFAQKIERHPEPDRHPISDNRGRFLPRDDKPASAATRPFKEPPGPTPESLAQAENVLRAFNTWAFKREQPSDPQLMLQFIAEAVAAKQAIPFVLYWGKGPRHQTGPYEAQCLDFLAALASRVTKAYAPGAAIKLILTDTHAELNGHCREHIKQYFDDVAAIAAQRGFQTCWLGHLVKAAGALATAAPIEEAVSPEMLSRLMTSAEKWYHGGGTAQEGALTYLRMNLIEQRVVERTFPRAIFVTFNGSELRGLFPRQLPIFYMYSLRRGVAVKPWFLPCQATAGDSSGEQPNAPRPN